MNEPARTSHTPPPQNVYAPPAWILDDVYYHRLRPEHRHFLAIVAANCPARRPRGDLVGCLGGPELARLAGCSPRAAWRRIHRLEQYGFLAVICRGGRVNGRQAVNVYGIPGRPGSLDAYRIRRRRQRMAPTGDGTWHPQVMEPGEQPSLWAWADAGPRPTNHRSGIGQCDTSAESGIGQCDTSARDVGPETGARPLSRRSDTVWSKNDGKHHGAARPGRRRLPHVHIADLMELPRLLNLYACAVAAGLVDASEAGRLDFVAAAYYARRTGRKPAAWFAYIVRHGRYLFVTQADERAAHQALCAHLYGEGQAESEDF